MKNYDAYFKNEKLYLRKNEWLYVVNPEKLSVRFINTNNIDSGVWKSCKLYFNLFPENTVAKWQKNDVDYSIKSKAVALSKFYNKLPQQYVLFLANFGDSQWQILKYLLKKDKNVEEFVFTNPSLAFFLFNFSVKRFDVKKIVTLKRRLILKKLNLVEKNNIVKLICKIPVCELAFFTAQNFLKILKENNVYKSKILNHSPVISKTLIYLLQSNLYRHFSNKLLFEIAEKSVDNDKLLKRIKLIEYASQEVVAVGADFKIRKMNSFRQFDDMLNQVMEFLNNPEEYIENFSLENKKFPEPPFEGNEKIIPIVSYEELKKFGDEQQHCIANYAKRIILNLAYVYKFIGEEENFAILLIRDNINEQWRLFDVRGYRNCPISGENKHYVLQWCKNNSISTIQSFFDIFYN